LSAGSSSASVMIFFLASVMLFNACPCCFKSAAAQCQVFGDCYGIVHLALGNVVDASVHGPSLKMMYSMP
jgi:hypothetical protein